MPLPCCRSDAGQDMRSRSGHTLVTTSTDALQRVPQPAQIFVVVVGAYCSAFVFEGCQAAIVDPISFASDILAYSFSVYVASVIFYIAVQLAKGSIANITEA